MFHWLFRLIGRSNSDRLETSAQPVDPIVTSEDVQHKVEQQTSPADQYWNSEPGPSWTRLDMNTKAPKLEPSPKFTVTSEDGIAASDEELREEQERRLKQHLCDLEERFGQVRLGSPTQDPSRTYKASQEEKRDVETLAKPEQLPEPEGEDPCKGQEEDVQTRLESEDNKCVQKDEEENLRPAAEPKTSRKSQRVRRREYNKQRVGQGAGKTYAARAGLQRVAAREKGGGLKTPRKGTEISPRKRRRNYLDLLDDTDTIPTHPFASIIDGIDSLGNRETLNPDFRR
jgi:hypothetical protein